MYLDNTILLIAMVYSEADAIYLPVRSDFRTRLYSDVYGLS